MRIVHVIASMDPAQGGPPVVVECLAKAQASLGHAVTIAAATLNAGCATPTVQLPPCGMSRLFRPVPGQITQVLSSADLLHLHGIWEPLLPTVARAARQLGLPYVITPHGMLDPWSLAQKKWKKKVALALAYRRMLDGAAALHLLNADEQRLLTPLALRTPGAVIPNGIFLDELDPPPDPSLFQSRLNGPRGRPYILFLSRLHYKKGLDLLADAFAELAAEHPGIDLVVAGPDGGEAQRFSQQIEKLGLADRTRMTGPLYGAEKWSALVGASVFCLPSRQEGFSVAILEALACRVPVVVSESCHFPEVAEVGAGRIVALQASSIAAALREILANPEAVATMGQAGRLLVEQRFTWPAVAGQMLSLYERLHKSTPAR